MSRPLKYAIAFAVVYPTFLVAGFLKFGDPVDRSLFYYLYGFIIWVPLRITDFLITIGFAQFMHPLVFILLPGILFYALVGWVIGRLLDKRKASFS